MSPAFVKTMSTNQHPQSPEGPALSDPPSVRRSGAAGVAGNSIPGSRPGPAPQRRYTRADLDALIERVRREAEEKAKRSAATQEVDPAGTASSLPAVEASLRQRTAIPPLTGSRRSHAETDLQSTYSERRTQRVRLSETRTTPAPVQNQCLQSLVLLTAQCTMERHSARQT